MKAGCMTVCTKKGWNMKVCGNRKGKFTSMDILGRCARGGTRRVKASRRRRLYR